MEARRERQQAILDRKRAANPWRAVRLTVAYFDQTLMGGWHAFLDSISGCGHVWIDRDAKYLQEHLMRLFVVNWFIRWHEWKIAFANKFKRRMQDGKPVGVAFLWKRGNELERRVTT